MQNTTNAEKDSAMICDENRNQLDMFLPHTDMEVDTEVENDLCHLNIAETATSDIEVDIDENALPNDDFQAISIKLSEESPKRVTRSSVWLTAKTAKNEKPGFSKRAATQSSSLKLKSVEECENTHEAKAEGKPVLKVRDLSLFAKRDEDSEESHDEESQTITVWVQVHSIPTEEDNGRLSPKIQEIKPLTCNELNTIDFDKIEMYESPKKFQSESLTSDFLYAQSLQEQDNLYVPEPESGRYNMRKRKTSQEKRTANKKQPKPTNQRTKDKKTGAISKREPSNLPDEYETVIENPSLESINRNVTFSYLEFAKNLKEGNTEKANVSLPKPIDTTFENNVSTFEDTVKPSARSRKTTRKNRSDQDDSGICLVGKKVRIPLKNAESISDSSENYEDCDNFHGLSWNDSMSFKTIPESAGSSSAVISKKGQIQAQAETVDVTEQDMKTGDIEYTDVELKTFAGNTRNDSENMQKMDE